MVFVHQVSHDAFNHFVNVLSGFQLEYDGMVRPDGRPVFLAFINRDNRKNSASANSGFLNQCSRFQFVQVISKSMHFL